MQLPSLSRYSCAREAASDSATQSQHACHQQDRAFRSACGGISDGRGTSLHVATEDFEVLLRELEESLEEPTSPTSSTGWTSPSSTPAYHWEQSPADSSPDPHVAGKWLTHALGRPVECPSEQVGAGRPASSRRSRVEQRRWLRARRRARLSMLMEAVRQVEEAKIDVRPGDVARLRRLFTGLDRNGSGLLTQHELEHAKQLFAVDPLACRLVQRAMDQLRRSGTGTLDLEEFLALYVESSTSHLQRLFQDIALICLYFLLAAAIYCNFQEPKWSVWEALYFAAATLMTVGYGDLAPSSTDMKMFTVCFIFFGMLVVARLIDSFVGMVFRHYEARLERSLDGAAEGKAEDPESQRAVSKTSSASGSQCQDQRQRMVPLCSNLTLWKILTSVVLFLLPISVGTVFFMLNEGWSATDAVYWTVVTCSTVGYGDLDLTQESSQIFSVFFMVLGVACFCAAYGNVGTLQLELSLARQKQRHLQRGLSSGVITAMADSGESIERLEFLCAMLIRMGRVRAREIDELLDSFDRVDADGDGRLTAEDLRLLRMQAQESRARVKARPPGLQGSGRRAARDLNPACAKELPVPSGQRLPSLPLLFPVRGSMRQAGPQAVLPAV